MTRWTRSLIVASLVVSVVSVSAPAQAQASPTVTLKASDKQFSFGKTITLSGAVTPATPDQEIEILDEDGTKITSATTNNQGKYSTRITPRHNLNLRAYWTGTPSDEVPIKVRPIVDVKLKDVRLFDEARAWGQVSPGTVPGKITVLLRRWGKVYKKQNVRIGKGGWFKTKFEVNKPGGFKVTAVYNGEDNLATKDNSAAFETPLPNLSQGSSSIYVKLLEKRLRQLNYRTPQPNMHFNYRTSDPLIAFNKVQGRPRVGYVTATTWKALASPKIPKPRFSWPKYHIEVDQTKQVLYRVKKGKVISIMHVSTGAGNATRDGTFNFDSKLAGYSSKRLYMPSFFDGARAIHGWPEVPTYNASHGCVRVPMWQAEWIFSKVEIGQLIRIYH